MKYITLLLAFSCLIISGTTVSGVEGQPGVQDSTRYVFIGAEACASRCHNTEEMGYGYNKWKAGVHSGAYDVLATEKALKYARIKGIQGGPQNSLVCLKCHITGAGADNASIGPTYKKEDGVTCEACHKGEFHPKTFLPEKKDCLRCHNDSVHEVPPFDFNDGVLKIAHPRVKKNLSRTTGDSLTVR